MHPSMTSHMAQNSTALLREITRGQDLVLVFSDVDAYGRIVARAWVGNVDIDAEMVRRGGAWFDSVYSDDDELFWIEAEPGSGEWVSGPCLPRTVSNHGSGERR